MRRRLISSRMPAAGRVLDGVQDDAVDPVLDRLAQRLVLAGQRGAVVGVPGLGRLDRGVREEQPHPAFRAAGLDAAQHLRLIRPLAADDAGDHTGPVCRSGLRGPVVGVGDEGAPAASAHQQPFRDEVVEGPDGGGRADAEALAQLVLRDERGTGLVLVTRHLGPQLIFDALVLGPGRTHPATTLSTLTRQSTLTSVWWWLTHYFKGVAAKGSVT